MLDETLNEMQPLGFEIENSQPKISQRQKFYSNKKQSKSISDKNQWMALKGQNFIENKKP